MKKAFTLTELIIALVVLGILVAVVSPAIFKTRPDKNKVMIKKAYYLTQDVVLSLINDDKFYPERPKCIQKNCAWGFDWDNEVNYGGETYSGATKFQKLFASKLNIKSHDDDYNVFTTNDGIGWDFSSIKGKSEAIALRWILEKIAGLKNMVLSAVNLEDITCQKVYATSQVACPRMVDSCCPMGNDETPIPITDDCVQCKIMSMEGFPGCCVAPLSWTSCTPPTPQIKLDIEIDTDIDTDIDTECTAGTAGGWTKCMPSVKQAGEPFITIDVDGFNKGSNCFQSDCNSDFDRFRIIIMANGQIKIHEDDKKATLYIAGE
ncbi:MAG: type II secretion system GspH family protein [Heliobacteriaceae bacterium]|nr:type II secretion system GspH family protein [Heliobacteriaceae bacterium]